MSQESLTIQTQPVAELGSLQGRRERLIRDAKALGALATEKYFHGTNYPLEIGDEIYPGDQAIIDSEGRQHASATTNEYVAWNYANQNETSYGGRARVYEVVPSDGAKAQALGPQRGEVNSPSFTIVGQIDVQPDYQGTLPLDWSKQHPYIGANHPEDPLYVAESHNIHNYVAVDPSEVPLLGLGEDYVQSELERMRVADGRPKM